MISALLGLSLALVPQVSELDRAHVLDGVARLGFTQNQIPVLLDASEDAAAAAKRREDVYASLRRDEAALSPIVQALAAGQQLTEAQRSQISAAELRRQTAETEYTKAVNMAVAKVIAALPYEQKFNMAVPANVRNSARETLNQLRSVSNENWPRYARQVADRLTREEERELRRTMLGNQGGRDRRQQSAQNSAYRAAREELRNNTVTYLNRLRTGSGNTVDFERRYALANYSQERADENLNRIIREIITHPAAVEALAKRVAGG